MLIQSNITHISSTKCCRSVLFNRSYPQIIICTGRVPLNIEGIKDHIDFTRSGPYCPGTILISRILVWIVWRGDKGTKWVVSVIRVYEDFLGTVASITCCGCC